MLYMLPETKQTWDFGVYFIFSLLCSKTKFYCIEKKIYLFFAFRMKKVTRFLTFIFVWLSLPIIIASFFFGQCLIKIQAHHHINKIVYFLTIVNCF